MADLTGGTGSTGSEEFSLEKYIKKMEMMEKAGDGLNLAGDFTNIFGAHINYNALKGDLKNYEIQAESVELAAKQQANQIRQQFLQTAANYSYTAARRGISVNSASVQQNLEGSAIAMNKDIQRMDQNAHVKANALRADAKIKKAYAKAERNRQVTDSMVSIIGTSSKYMGS